MYNHPATATIYRKWTGQQKIATFAQIGQTHIGHQSSSLFPVRQGVLLYNNVKRKQHLANAAYSLCSKLVIRWYRVNYLSAMLLDFASGTECHRQSCLLVWPLFLEGHEPLRSIRLSHLVSLVWYPNHNKASLRFAKVSLLHLITSFEQRLYLWTWLTTALTWSETGNHSR